MKHAFITVRFDRMKNQDLSILCKVISELMSRFDMEQLQLKFSLDRFNELKPLLKNLDPKQRKLSQTKELEALRKRQEEVVTAMLLHLKAIERARFEDQEDDLRHCKYLLRKLFAKFVHQGMSMRTGEIQDAQTCLRTMDEFRRAVTALGLLRYLNTLTELDKQYHDKWRERLDVKTKRPVAGIAIPSKEQIISELRFLLMSIDVTASTHPENDYRILIEDINYELVKARAQIRNLSTRRKTAKAKAEKKLNESNPKTDTATEK